ncbi:MAG: peptide deformylase [Candidatus Dormibacteria bacterium]
MKSRPPLQLVTDPAAVLHHRAEPVRVFDGALRRLVDEMFERCVEWHGVGLAAPQVGLNLQLAVIVYEGHRFPIINPQRLSETGEVDAQEGCLSLPHQAGLVRRFEAVSVRYRNLHGKGVGRDFDGWLARIVQHESDHLQGTLCSQRLAPGATFDLVADDEEEDEEAD